MTATAQPGTRAPAALDRAAGLELLGEVHGSGYADGVSLVRRADGQMVQLGPLMYALLEAVDGVRDEDALAVELCERLGRACDADAVRALAEKLAAQGLLAGTEQHAPPRSNPLLALRWKVLVTNPAVTRRLTAPFTFLFRPWIVWPVVACFVAAVWLVLFRQGVGAATSQAFHTPSLLLGVFLVAVASAGFHELGHAAAARYGGATPGGMGMGLYVVWPAFYTDVTDAYRLPKRDRLRVDLGGIYFNAIVCVAAVAVWLGWRRDAVLLLVPLQLLMMVKNLSPVIRSDGYHVLADLTGIHDLYAHIGPTLRRLVPWRDREPSALTGRARLLVTLWVLVVVPVLLSMMLGAVLLMPRLAATAWSSGSRIAGDLPHQLSGFDVLGVLASLLQLLALVLPVLGTVLIAEKLVATAGAKANAWADGRPARQTGLALATAGAFAVAAWAWWPAGQYRPVQPTERATLSGFVTRLASSPTRLARPAPPPVARPVLRPGKHLALSLIPVGGATKEHPAYFVIRGTDGNPSVAFLSSTSPDPSDPAAVEATATAVPIDKTVGIHPGSDHAVAIATRDGSIVYDVAYSLVTVRDGAPVTNTNSAVALSSCKACASVAVSFQVVLIVGESRTVAPINAALAKNTDCPACVAVAIADQIVVTVKSEPTPDLVAKLQAALRRLDALPELGSVDEINALVADVQKDVDAALAASGQLARTTTASTATAATTGTTGTTTAPTATAATTTSATTTAEPTTTAAATTTPTTTAGTSTATTTTAETTTTATTTTTSG